MSDGPDDPEESVDDGADGSPADRGDEESPSDRVSDGTPTDGTSPGGATGSADGDPGRPSTRGTDASSNGNPSGHSPGQGQSGSRRGDPTAGNSETPAGRSTAAGESPSGRGSERSRTDPAEYTTDRRSLSPKVQVHWAVRTVIGAFVLGLITAAILNGLDQDPLFGLGVMTALILLGLVWVALQYRVWVYQIRGDAIYLERGVVTHVRTLVPYVRIQHVDTSRSPLERALGLSTLVVYTAGSRGADVSIPGLTPAEASDLQQRVKELAIEAEGDDAL